MSKSTYKVFRNTSPHFITCTIVDWLPLLRDQAITNIILSSLQFMISNQRFKIFAYVIMDNHLHLITSSKNLSDEIRKFKSFTARKIIDHLVNKNEDQILGKLADAKLIYKTDREYQVWQEGSHPQMIQNEEMMRQKIEYIHYNPVKRGFVDDALDWRYSSAQNYEGLEGLLEVEKSW